MEYKIKMKTSYDELSLYEYKAVTDILLTDTELFNKEVEVVRLLVEPEFRDVIDNLPLSELSKLIAHTTFLEEPIEPKGVKSSYKILDRRFKCIVHPTKLTTAQFIDLINVTKDANSIMDELDKIVSIFLIPEGKSYNTDYDMSEMITFIGENCPITIAKEIGFFFANAQIVLRKLSEQYLVKSAKKILKKKDIPMELRQQLENQLSQVTGDGYN